MKLKKLLVLGLALACIATISITATLAYFTDVTEVVNNTFTMGSIDIDLDEADVDENGDLIYKKDNDGNDTDELADRVKENEYKLFPGSNYLKDPTVHVLEGSEKCFVYVRVWNGLADIEAEYIDEAGVNHKKIVDQLTANNWESIDYDETTGMHVYAYKGVVDAAEADVDLVVFDGFAIQGNNLVSPPEGVEVPEGMINLQDYLEANITITAYAIQAENFGDDYNAAWEAYVGQNEPKNTEEDSTENQ